jgi:hypothetical protein
MNNCRIGGIKMLKHKKLLVIVAIVASLIMAHFLGALPYMVARTASSIYSAINYPERKLRFQRGEYAYGFGDYSVVYKDKNGNVENFMLAPKEFPFFVVWDSIKQDGFGD